MSQFGQSYTECLRVARMYGFDFTFHYRPDGRVDTISGWAGKPTAVCQFPNQQHAVQGMYNIIRQISWQTIGSVEVGKAIAAANKKGWVANATR